MRNMKSICLIFAFIIVLSSVPNVEAGNARELSFIEEFTDWSGISTQPIDNNTIIVCVGDSLTNGSFASQDQNGNNMGYPYRLNETIYSTQPNSNISVINEGGPGDEAADVLARVSDINNHSADIIFVMIGTNDLGHHNNFTRFQENYSALLISISENNTDSTIITSSIPNQDDYGAYTWYDHIMWNTWLEDYTEGRGYQWFDVYNLLENSTDYLYLDDLHYNDHGYNKVAMELYDAILTNVFYSTNVNIVGGVAYQNFTTGISTHNRSRAWSSFNDKGSWDQWTFTGSWSTGKSSTYRFGGSRIGSALNDSVNVTIYGGGDLFVYYNLANSRGIINVSVDGSVIGTIDMYNSTFDDKRFTVYQNALGEYDKHYIDIEMVDKNASSSGYDWSFEGLMASENPIPQTYVLTSKPYLSSGYYTLNDAKVTVSTPQTEVNITTEPSQWNNSGDLDFIRYINLSHTSRHIKHNNIANDMDPNITFTYIGTNFTIWYDQVPASGTFQVYLDEVLQTTLSSADTIIAYGAFYRKTGVSYGQHTIRLQPLSGKIFLEGIDYTTYNYNIQVYNSNNDTWELVENNQVSSGWDTEEKNDLFRYRIITYSGSSYDNVSLTLNVIEHSRVIVQTEELVEFVYVLAPFMILVVVLGMISDMARKRR